MRRKKFNIKLYVMFLIIIYICFFVKIDVVKPFTLPTNCAGNCKYTRNTALNCWLCPTEAKVSDSYLKENKIYVSSTWPYADNIPSNDQVHVKISTNVNNENYRVFCLEKGKGAPSNYYTYAGRIEGRAACAAINFLDKSEIEKFKTGSRNTYLINPGTTNYVKIQKYVWRIISHRNDTSGGNKIYTTSSCDEQIFGFREDKLILKLDKTGENYKGKIQLNKDTGKELTENGNDGQIKVYKKNTTNEIYKDVIKLEIDGDWLYVEMPSESVDNDNLKFDIKIDVKKGSVIRPFVDIYNSNDGYQDVGLIYFGKAKAKADDEITVEIDKELSPCEIDLNELNNPTPQELITLYKKYSEDKYNGLLNFSNPTCSVVEKNVEPINNCLEANYDANFSSEDVSNFDTAKLDVESTFCKLSYNIENIMQDSKYSLKSGMLMYFNLEDVPIMNATIVEKCYSYESSEINISSDLSNIITDVKIGGVNLSENPSEQSIQSNHLGNGIIEYTKKMQISYNLPLIYAISGTGEIVYAEDYNDKCIIEEGEEKSYICQEIGRGIPTKFTDKQNSKLPFSYQFDGKVQNADCEYNIERKIVKCDESKENCNLNLAFRTINTKFADTAFSDKHGHIREPGQNWCTSIKNRVIETRNDSTGKKGNVPLYTIELTSDKIKDIRDYNKTSGNSYNTPLYCNAEGVCESKFLKEKFPNLQRNNELQWEIDFNTMLYGDVNLNGVIDINDATAINLYLAGYSYSDNCTGFSKELSDVNADGKIDEEDSKAIQNFMVGKKIGVVGETYKKIENKD